MPSLSYQKVQKLSLLNHSQLNELWVQNIIAEEPTSLGLGDVVLKDRERLQPRAGRLDLLLQYVETNRRYEVEIQLEGKKRDGVRAAICAILFLDPDRYFLADPTKNIRKCQTCLDRTSRKPEPIDRSYELGMSSAEEVNERWKN